jgi:arginine-tRNA-protein transferase
MSLMTTVEAQSRERRTRLVARALEAEGIAPGPRFPCPHLPGRRARHEAFTTPPVRGLYQTLMDLNFRRLGPVFYRPRCEGCDECRMLRVPVADFRPSRSQRRCFARNADVGVELAPPQLDDERHALFRRYLAARHDGTMDGSVEELRSLAGASPVETLELAYRLGGRLVGVSIADFEPDAMSAVYCYFAPDEPRRSLGVFNVLTMIGECRRRGLTHLYLGYYVRDCRKMSYKDQYRPCEILRRDGGWQRRD